MKRLRLPLSRRCVGLLLAPFALWTLVILLVPTEWARSRFAERLSAATNQTVELEGLTVGFLGGVRLQKLSFADPAAGSEPWLRVHRLKLNLSLAHVLFGQCEPSKVVAEGVLLTLHRRADGSFQLGNLLASRPSSPSMPAGQSASSAADTMSSSAGSTCCAMDFRVHNGQLKLIDEPSDTALTVESIEARGTWDSGRATIQEFRSILNGGDLRLVGQLDRSSRPPRYEGQVRAVGVELTDDMGVLCYVAPVLASSAGRTGGKLDLALYLRGQGLSRAELNRSLVGRGAVSIDPIEFEGADAVTELFKLLELPSKNRVGSLRSQFVVGDGKVSSDDLTLTLSQVPIVLSGSTDFQGRIDYQVRQEGLTRHLSSEARDLLADLPVDLDNLLALGIQGTLAHPTITLDGLPLGQKGAQGGPPRLADERARMRELGRRLRQRLLR